MPGPSKEQWVEACSQIMGVTISTHERSTVCELTVKLIPVSHPDDTKFDTWFFEGHVTYEDGSSTYII